MFHDKHTQSLFIWSGPIAILLFFMGLVVFARMIPPPISPTTPIKDVVEFYSDHRLGISVGEIVVLLASGFMMPFMLVVFAQLRRIEKGFPFLSLLYLFCNVIIVFEIIIPPWVFSTLVFRANRPDEVLLALSDLGWIILIWPNPQTVIMLAAVGYAILRDRHPHPLFPRWMGFLNLALSLLFFGSTFSNMIHSGPLAWNGLVALWLPAIDFGIWFFIMFFALRKAASRDDYVATLA